MKSALEGRYKDFLKHDWLEDGLTFSLMENYTDLSWAKMVNKPMERDTEPIKHMDDILNVPGAGVVCVKILIEGEYVICCLSKIHDTGCKTISCFIYIYMSQHCYRNTQRLR